MANETKNTSPEAPFAQANPAPDSDALLALIEEQGAVIADQQEKLAKLEELAKNNTPAPKSSAAAGGTFKVGNKEYRVMHAIRIRREGTLVTVSAEEILKDKELRERLLGQGSSAIQPA